PYFPQQIRVYYLEDILEWTNYSTPQMNEASVYMAQDYVRCYNMYFWITNKESDNYAPNEYKMSIRKEPSAPDNFYSYLYIYIYMSFQKKTMFPMDQFALDLESDQTNGIAESDLVSKARESVNNLLWAIWNVKVLLYNNSGLRRYHMEEIDETEIRTDTYSCLTNLLQFVLSGWISVDYEHSDSGLTPLMVCSAAGLLEAVKSLLSLGANPFIRVAIPYDPRITSTCKQNGDFKLFGPKCREIIVRNKNYTVVGVTAYDLARIFNNNEVENLLKTYMITSSLRNEPENWEAILLRFGSWFQSPVSKSQYDNCVFDDYETVVTQMKNVEKMKVLMNPQIFYNKSLLSYQLARNTMDSETVIDFDLLTSLVVKIDSSLPRGAILIFLPSYEEIMILRGRLQDPNTCPWKSQKYVTDMNFGFHGSSIFRHMNYMENSDSWLWWREYLKLILSSNIAESSITLNDVVYVVDCGLNRIITSLRNQWILKSNAIQRQTRIGANVNGICFRLYSSLRFNTFFEQRQDSLRGHAVEEACIQARLLGPPNIPIQTALNTLPKPPSPESSENAIKTLKEMDALNSLEELTELGYHIYDMPIPAHYAKMVLFSVVLKCLDPILTIASILAYTEPFTLPKNSTERRDLINIQRYLSSNSYSDHIVLLRAFQVVLDPHSVVATDADGAKININKLPCDWLVFNEMLTLTDRKSNISSEYNNADHVNLKQIKVIRCVSVVSTVTVALMAGPIGVYPQILNESRSSEIGKHTASQSSISQRNDKVSVCLDTNTSLCFTISSNEAQMVIELRQKWHALFLRRLKNPGKQGSQQDEAVLKGLINVLTTEEKALGLRQPSGIGARPRPMVAELYNQVDCSQGYCFQDMKTANEQPLNNRYIPTTCATTENVATLPVSLTNTSLLKLNDATCSSSAFTNAKCVRDLNVSDLNTIFKQYSPQTCKIDISRSIYDPTNQINNSSTKKWRYPLPKKITDNTDYVSLSQQSNMDILLPEDEGVLPINSSMLNCSNRLVTIQNYQFDPLSDLKSSNILENNKHQQYQSQKIKNKILCTKIQNHCSAIMEDEICSYILYGSHTPNMAIPNSDDTHLPTTCNNKTMKNTFHNCNDAVSTSQA
ncbi:hypothetical protein MN116_002967, partial [Schistosoma mekongi]